MSEAFTPLTVQQTVAAATLLRQRVDGALSINRGLTGLADTTIVSMAIFVGQFDALAQAAAAHLARPRDLDAWAALQEQLLQAGYLPVQQSPASQEASHGEG